MLISSRRIAHLFFFTSFCSAISSIAQASSQGSDVVDNNDMGSENPSCQPPCVPGDESIMSTKEDGSSQKHVQKNLRWGCDWDTADYICNNNHIYAEYSGYWEETSFLNEVTANVPTIEDPVIFYDSNTGRKLFQVPVADGRVFHDFLEESHKHGWPSFRDDEVNWNMVRVLPSGETISVDGTHLGHNLPDEYGNRFCLNLVCLAGQPVAKST